MSLAGKYTAIMEEEEEEEEEEEKEEKEEDIQEAASSIVGGVIKDAVRKIVTLQKEEAGAKHTIRNIAWMRCKDFSVGRGLLQIEDYMKDYPCKVEKNKRRFLPTTGLLRKLTTGSCEQTWELHESWLHWSNYLNNEELKYSTQYYYRVRWSIPTCRKPIPRAMACVYFVIEISKIKPKTLPIEVFFVVETNKLIHRPGNTRFKEKWLKDVIESKAVMMETVDF